MPHISTERLRAVEIYGDPAEKFEDVTLLLHRPLKDATRPEDVWVKLYRAGTGMKEISEAAYFRQMLDLYNDRNPHAMIGEDADEGEIEFKDTDPEGAVETEEE